MPNIFQSLLAGVFGPESDLDEATRKALARAVDLVDPHLNGVPGLGHRLGPAIAEALRYGARLVDQLPGPLPISRKAFAAEPLVHALFATAADIDRMLGTSQAVRDFLTETESYQVDHFHALFAARRIEKRQFGVVSYGDVIRTEVPQTVLYFSDHTLTEPSGDLARLRTQLQETFFDSLLRSFATHLRGMREERENVRAGLSVERAHLTVLRGKTGGPGLAVHTRRLAELDAKLRQIGDGLAPPALLDTLNDFLQRPADSLRLEPVAMTVDRLGVVADPTVLAIDTAASAAPAANAYGFETLRFPEMIARDRRRYMVMLARVDVAEARQAVERVTEAQRRFLII